MVPKPKRAGVEGDEPLALVGAGWAERDTTAVELVTEQRKASRSALHADLVRAAGFQRDFQQRLVGEALQHLVVQDGVTRRSIGRFSDDRARLAFNLLEVIYP